MQQQEQNTGWHFNVIVAAVTAPGVWMQYFYEIDKVSRMPRQTHLSSRVCFSYILAWSPAGPTTLMKIGMKQWEKWL